MKPPEIPQDTLRELRGSEKVWHSRLVGRMINYKLEWIFEEPFAVVKDVRKFPLRRVLEVLRTAKKGAVLEDWKGFMRAIGQDPYQTLKSLDELVLRLEKAEKAARKK